MVHSFHKAILPLNDDNVSITPSPYTYTLSQYINFRRKPIYISRLVLTKLNEVIWMLSSRRVIKLEF